MHSFINYSLSSYYVPGPALDAWDTQVSKGGGPFPDGANVLTRSAVNTIHKSVMQWVRSHVLGALEPCLRCLCNGLSGPPLSRRHQPGFGAVTAPQPPWFLLRRLAAEYPTGEARPCITRLRRGLGEWAYGNVSFCDKEGALFHKVGGSSDARRGSDAEQPKGCTHVPALAIWFPFTSSRENLREWRSPQIKLDLGKWVPERPGADLCNLMGKCGRSQGQLLRNMIPCRAQGNNAKCHRCERRAAPDTGRLRENVELACPCICGSHVFLETAESEATSVMYSTNIQRAPARHQSPPVWVLGMQWWARHIHSH